MKLSDGEYMAKARFLAELSMNKLISQMEYADENQKKEIIMKDKIFKDKPIKKTLVESIQNTDGEIVGAYLLNNDNQMARFVEIGEDKKPILTDQESAQLKNEQKEFNTDNPLEAHEMAVAEKKNGNNENSESNDK